MLRPLPSPSAAWHAEDTTSRCEVYEAALKLEERPSLSGIETHTSEAVGILDSSGGWTKQYTNAMR